MMPIGIAGIGMYTSAGNTDDTWAAVSEGRSTRAPLPENIAEYVKPRWGHMADVPGGPYNRLVRMAMMAIDEAMPSLGDDFPPATALCIGSTTAGFRENQNKAWGREVDEQFLAPSALSQTIAQHYGIERVFQFSQACASSGYAIAAGCDLINQGYADVVLAGGVDELLPCVIDAFSECRIYAEECTPFDMKRKGLVLGEAAAFVLLARDELMKKYRRPCYITGIGLTCDANDMAAPYYPGIARAIEDACPGIAPNFVVAHATGTKAGDQAEAMALAANEMSHIPVASYKGVLGHPQGASGAVGVILGALSYFQESTFPSTGFRHPDPDLHGLNISTGTRLMFPGHILCLSEGTWGVNSAIVLGQRRDHRGEIRKEREGIVELHPTVEWPKIWAENRLAGRRIKPTEFGLTVSNCSVGDRAIKMQLLGPQITLAHGDPYEIAKMQVVAGRAEMMLVGDPESAGIYDEVR